MGNDNAWCDVMYDVLKWEPEDNSYRRIDSITITEMLDRLEGSHRAFVEFIQQVQTENLWDQEWVDDTCDEPHTFSIGGVIEETMTSNIVTRTILERQVNHFGFDLSRNDN